MKLIYGKYCLFFLLFSVHIGVLVTPNVSQSSILESQTRTLIISILQHPADLQAYQMLTQQFDRAIALFKNKVETIVSGNFGNSDIYPHKPDTVFDVRKDHFFGIRTIHYPSYISQHNAIALAQKCFNEVGLSVDIKADRVVQVASEVSLEGQSITLEELDTYGIMSDISLQEAIQALKSKSAHHPQLVQYQQQIELLQRIEKLKPYLFWHVDNPTVGVHAQSIYSLPEGFEPLSWKFDLWELAPLQGKGIKIGMIDTGVAAFKIEGLPEYKQNINVQMPNVFSHYGYNLVADGGLNPFEQYALFVEQYCDSETFDYQEFLYQLPAIITDFLKTNNGALLETYFINHAKSKYLASGKRLNGEGKKILKSLLYGSNGIAPKDGSHQSFHLVKVTQPYAVTAIKESLPICKVTNEESTYIAGHGTFTSSIVGARQVEGKGISGIAPQASVIMIKAFKDDGKTTQSTLNAALKECIMQGIDVVNMSLKITDSFSLTDAQDVALERLINSMQYVVAASGNNANFKAAAKQEAYPGHFATVAFDVGSFEYASGKYNICPFTQREKNIGPKFASPGFNILGAGLVPDQQEDSVYLFMDGTSVSAPIITGFLALVLAEFKDTFTKKEILSVLYKCTLKLNTSKEWQDEILLGASDMRTALLVLRTLAYIKEDLQKKIKNKNFSQSFSDFSVEKSFNQLVEALCTVIYFVPLTYGTNMNIIMNKNMVGYHAGLLTHQYKAPHYFHIQPGSDPVMQAVTFLTESIYVGLGYTKNTSLPIALIDSISAILKSTSINLFAHLSPAVQNRLMKAIEHDVTKQDNFWKTQAMRCKKSAQEVLNEII